LDDRSDLRTAPQEAVDKSSTTKSDRMSLCALDHDHPNIENSIVPTLRTAGWKKLALAFVLVALVAVGSIALWKAGLLGTLSSRDQLVHSLRTAGVKGPLVCIGAQFVQVVIFAIPGEIAQFAAGYVFGIWKGFLYSIVGIMLGSAFNFLFGRVVGRPALERLIGKVTMAKVDALLNSAKGKSAIFLLFLIPGTPKDAMCYGAGFCNMTLFEFVVITGLGRTPALLASLVLGSLASRRDYDAMILTGVVTGAAILTYYIYERRRNRKLASKSKEG
jgi:uncharacterized membrane protein YdjX (TVP38/TMEM64 family)